MKSSQGQFFFILGQSSLTLDLSGAASPRDYVSSGKPDSLVAASWAHVYYHFLLEEVC